jgi:hypothetical protein
MLIHTRGTFKDSNKRPKQPSYDLCELDLNGNNGISFVGWVRFSRTMQFRKALAHNVEKMKTTALGWSFFI